MIKSLVINRSNKALEYEIEGGWIIHGKNDEKFPSEKIEVYSIMKQVIRNWNENNPSLPL